MASHRTRCTSSKTTTAEIQYGLQALPEDRRPPYLEDRFERFIASGST